MAYIIFTLDNSVIYDIRNNFLGLYFRDEKAISYSPFLVDQYFGYKGSSCIPKCDIEEFQYFPKSWDLHTVCGFEEFKHSSWYDELTAGQITLEIIRSDPLRYPSKQNNCLEEYGLLYQVRNRLTNQILSKNVLMPDKLLEEIFDDQDSVSTLFYSQELVFINLKCFKEFNITLEARLSTGYSQQSLLLYHYRDWTCGQLLEFIKNNEFPVNSYDCELCLFSSECEVTQYVSRGSNISVLADKAATVALSQSRIRFKLDPVPLVSKFHVKVIIDKSCQDEECISQVRKIEKFLKRRPDETEYIVAVMNEDIYFYLTTNDPIKEDELFRKPLFKIPFLQRLNVLKDGSQTIHLSKHILSSPISISTNRLSDRTCYEKFFEGATRCPAGLYLTFCMDYLSKKNFDVWLTRLNMPKSLRLLDPVLDSDKNCETAWSIKGYENSVNGGYEPSIKGGYYPSVTMNGETRSLSEHSKKFAFIDDFASMLSLN